MSLQGGVNFFRGIYERCCGDSGSEDSGSGVSISSNEIFFTSNMEDSGNRDQHLDANRETSSFGSFHSIHDSIHDSERETINCLLNNNSGRESNQESSQESSSPGQESSCSGIIGIPNGKSTSHTENSLFSRLNTIRIQHERHDEYERRGEGLEKDKLLLPTISEESIFQTKKSNQNNLIPSPSDSESHAEDSQTTFVRMIGDFKQGNELKCGYEGRKENTEKYEDYQDAENDDEDYQDAENDDQNFDHTNANSDEYDRMEDSKESDSSYYSDMGIEALSDYMPWSSPDYDNDDHSIDTSMRFPTTSISYNSKKAWTEYEKEWWKGYDLGQTIRKRGQYPGVTADHFKKKKSGFWEGLDTGLKSPLGKKSYPMESKSQKSISNIKTSPQDKSRDSMMESPSSSPRNNISNNVSPGLPSIKTSMRRSSMKRNMKKSSTLVMKSRIKKRASPMKNTSALMKKNPMKRPSSIMKKQAKSPMKKKQAKSPMKKTGRASPRDKPPMKKARKSRMKANTAMKKTTVKKSNGKRRFSSMKKMSSPMKRSVSGMKTIGSPMKRPMERVSNMKKSLRDTSSLNPSRQVMKSAGSGMKSATGFPKSMRLQKQVEKSKQVRKPASTKKSSMKKTSMKSSSLEAPPVQSSDSGHVARRNKSVQSCGSSKKTTTADGIFTTNSEESGQQRYSSQRDSSQKRYSAELMRDSIDFIQQDHSPQPFPRQGSSVNSAQQSYSERGSTQRGHSLDSLDSGRKKTAKPVKKTDEAVRKSDSSGPRRKNNDFRVSSPRLSQISNKEAALDWLTGGATKSAMKSGTKSPMQTVKKSNMKSSKSSPAKKTMKTNVKINAKTPSTIPLTPKNKSVVSPLTPKTHTKRLDFPRTPRLQTHQLQGDRDHHPQSDEFEKEFTIRAGMKTDGNAMKKEIPIKSSMKTEMKSEPKSAMKAETKSAMKAQTKSAIIETKSAINKETTSPSKKQATFPSNVDNRSNSKNVVKRDSLTPEEMLIFLRQECEKATGYDEERTELLMRNALR